MDCFYAAVEIRERPELRDRPVAVGGSGGRGVLTTCNYAARRYGVRSAMPVFQARQRCPGLIILPTRFDLYRAVSRQIRDILGRYSPLVEPLSLDEAYLDASPLRRRGAEIAASIREDIREATGLTASAGVAPNKLVAKIASDWRKPDGQRVVPPSEVPGFMRELPVRKIWGIGPKSSEKLAAMGIETCGQLQRWSMAGMAEHFGRFGLDLYHLCRGIDDRPVTPDRVRKSLGNERTFPENLEALDECEEALREQYGELLEDLRAQAADRRVAKAFVKLKFSDFRQTTAEAGSEAPDLAQFRRLLGEAWGRSGRSVRLLGVGVRFADTGEAGEQLELDLP